MINVVVYTAIVGNIDRLWSVFPAHDDVQHVAFVDVPKREVGLWGGTPPGIVGGTEYIGGLPVWEQREVEVRWGNRRTARHYKALPHRYMPDADVWIWVDGNVRLTAHPLEVAERYGKGELATFNHPDRCDVYQEATFCAKHGKDDRKVLAEQAARYRKAGLPERWGLAETRVVIRRNTEAMRALNEAWWAEIERFSVRDQVSLPFVCWRAGLHWNRIPGNCGQARRTTYQHPRFYYIGHNI